MWQHEAAAVTTALSDSGKYLSSLGFSGEYHEGLKKL
jgi:hypothetical protein